MYRYPSINEAKAHAKHIARTFNLKLTDAQEILSFTYSCCDWAELKSKQNSLASPEQLTYIDPFTYLRDEAEINELDGLISAHINTIKKHLSSSDLAPGSLLERLANRNYSQVSGQVVSQVLETFRDYEEYKASDGYQGFNSSDNEQIINDLMLSDDTINKVLHRKESSRSRTVNTHLEPKAYRQRFYAYYTFKDNDVHITSREWDLEVFRPTNNEDKLSVEQLHSVCSRKWFTDYMIGYLKLLIQQFRMAGYSGKVRICKIQNASVLTFYHNKTDDYSNNGIDKLFEALLELGGTYAWDTDKKGRKYNLGIEITFGKDCYQWMIGESSL